MLERDINSPLTALIFYTGVAVATCESLSNKKSTPKNEYERAVTIAQGMIAQSRTFIGYVIVRSERETWQSEMDDAAKRLGESRVEWQRNQKTKRFTESKD
jgi:hypothetical protein